MDTVEWIFRRKFKVKVPKLGLMALDGDDYGIPIPKNLLDEKKKLDPIDQAKYDYVSRYLTIAQMAEIYRKGFPIIAPDKQTAIDIYEAIESHLYRWKVHLETAVNKQNPPVEDLLLLDDMADEIFSRYKDRIAKRAISIDRFKSPMEKMGFRNRLRNVDKIEQKQIKRIEKKDIFLENYRISDIDYLTGEDDR